MMINTELKRLIEEIKTLQRKVTSLEAQQSAGQYSYDQTVVPASYSHQHMPSALQSGVSAADISWTGTHSHSGQVNFAGGTTYNIDSAGDAVFKNLGITQITVNNTGAGADPVFTCNSHLDILDLTGDLRMSEDYLFKSGTAFDGLLSHNISAARTWILPDVAGTIITSANPTDLDHDALTNFDANEHYLQTAITVLGAIATCTSFITQGNIIVDGTYALGAAAEDLDLGGFDLYGVAEIRGSPDTNHSIVFDPVADSIYIRPGDEATDYSLSIKSTGQVNTSVQLTTGGDGDGQIGEGITPNYWYKVWTYNLQLQSGSTVNDIDITMAVTPTDLQLLTAQGIKEYTNSQIRSVPSFVPFIGNGAVWNAFFCQPVIQMPGADNDCYCRFNLKIPDDWADGSCTVKIMYSIDGANAYSVKWFVTGLEATDNWVTEGYNVLNASTAYDFAAATANIIYVKSIALTDANIKAGGSLGVFCQSDANNTDELYIMEVWIEQ